MTSGGGSKGVFSDVFETDVTERFPKSTKYLIQILKLRSIIVEQLAISLRRCYITMNHVKRIPSDGLSDSFIVKEQRSCIAFLM